MARTDRISASYALNDIVANAPADGRELEGGDLFGIDISARKDGWSCDPARRWLAATMRRAGAHRGGDRNGPRSPRPAIGENPDWPTLITIS